MVRARRAPTTRSPVVTAASAAIARSQPFVVLDGFTADSRVD